LPSLLNRLIGNRFRRAFYAYWFPGQTLTRDQNLDIYLEDGYEKNPTIFGAANKIATIGASIPLIAMKGEEPSDRDPLKEIFEKRNDKADYTLNEHRRHWRLFRLLLGESLVYAPVYKFGTSAGLPMFFDIMPPQNIEIVTGGMTDPVKYYKVDEKDKLPLDPEDVFHSRAFLNVDFDEGKHFRGLSPLKVAANIISMMNSGDEMVKKLYDTGMPPGILYNKNIKGTEVNEQKSLLEKAWRSKNKDIPIIGGGELGWINLGFSSLRDLQVVESDKRGLRVICNIWGVHESLFSAERATLDNMKIARKLMYEDRQKPDIEDELEYLNKIFKPLGIHYVADYSQIEALQEDKEKIAKIYGLGIDKKAVTKNEFREAIGLEPIKDEVMGEEGLIDESQFIEPVQGIDEDEALE